MVLDLTKNLLTHPGHPGLRFQMLALIVAQLNNLSPFGSGGLCETCQLPQNIITRH